MSAYLQSYKGNELLGKLRKMRMLADDDDEVVASSATKSQTSQQPAWMRALLERCREWLGQLPEVWIPALEQHLVLIIFMSRNSTRWPNSQVNIKIHYIVSLRGREKSAGNSYTMCGKT